MFSLVICEGWHFTHIWETIARSYHFTKRGRPRPIKLVNHTPPYIEVPVPSQESERSCISVLGVLLLCLSANLLYRILELFRQ
jgi:hypothetical protein